MEIGPVTPQIPMWQILILGTIRQELLFLAEYLRYTDLHQIFSVCRRMCGDDYADIRSAVAQGTLLW